MKRSDRIRQGTFTIIFLAFVFYTLRYIDFDPYPKRLSQQQWKQWHAACVEEDSVVREGDLVLRHSMGFVSDAILTFQVEDPSYSHSGIVRKVDGKSYIYHSTGGEENVSQKMKRDPIAIFCHPAATYKFGIYRFDLTDAQRKRFLDKLDAYYEAELEFDLDFDMTTYDKMYCSEMIYRALVYATNDENYITLSKVIDKPYVAIDKLYLNDHCKFIYSYEYD